MAICFFAVLSSLEELQMVKKEADNAIMLTARKVKDICQLGLDDNDVTSLIILMSTRPGLFRNYVRKIYFKNTL